MTPQEQLITAARAEIGYHEGSGNYNKYAAGNVDNEIYGWELQNNYWCDVFVDVLFAQVFGTKKGMRMTYQYNEQTGRYIASAACRESANRYKANGAFYRDPKPGDQAFFYSGGEINHTGIVESVGSDTITTIEGNYSDSVARVVHKLKDSAIAGYGRPNWALAESNDEEYTPTEQKQPVIIQPEKQTATAPIIKTMSGTYPVLSTELERYRVPEVGALQTLLNLRGANIAVDEQFGKDTKAAVEAAQKRYGLAVDGRAGADTILALIKDKKA